MLFPLPLLKKLIAVFSILLLASLCWLTLKRSDLREAVPDKATGPQVNDGYGKLPLQFEPNEGQAPADVEFLTRGSGYTLFLKQTEAVLSLRKADMRLKLLGSNPAARISALDVLPGKVNHFIGNDRAKWRTNISTYGKVKYEDVYPGIDLIYYGDQGRLEYDFVVAPKTDPQLIQLSFPEAKELQIDQAGALIVKVQDVELRQPKPLIYQETATGRRIIDGKYILKGRESFAFEIGDYDRNEPLIIDPTLTYSTLLGTTTAESIAVDDAGNAYITGQIDSDVYVLKLNPSGTALIYSALIGGTQDDECKSLALDSGGNVYVTGTTLSTNFPTVNAMQPTHGNNGVEDAFVFKLNSIGNALSYSTYLGGDGFDGGASIAVNSTGNAFVTGTTASTNFPVVNALQPVGFQGDVFVSKFSPTGNALVYSTYIGGSGGDSGFGLALDSQDQVYITGNTDSLDFPITNDARQSTARGPDTFLLKLNSSGNALLYSSYHGGSATDLASSIAVHSDGSIYVTGFTFSTDFPLVNPLQSTPHFTSLFVTKFDSSGKSIIYSTYLGGDGFDVPVDLTTDSSGNLYITGKTDSTNFPLVQPLKKSQPGPFHPTNVFVAKLNPSGSALLFSTYLGSSISDQGNSIAVRNGSIFVAGNTFGVADFPVTSGAFRQNHFEEDGSIEGFALRIDTGTNTNYYSISGIVFGSTGGVSGTLVTLSGSTSRRVRTDFNGRYSFHTLIEGGTYTVTPTSQFNFSPASRTFANLNADQPNADFVVLRPPNDNFADAQVISSTSGVINGTNVGATVEPGEALNGSRSVWYRWQATSTGTVMLNYTPSQGGMLLEVFTGSSVGNLTNVSARFTDCESLGCNQSAASFKSVAGTVYFIRVAGVSSSGTFGFSFAPGGPTISGQVKNVNGRSLKGFAVRANILGQNKIATITTTDNGYSLVVPSGGSYSVVAVSPFGLPIPIDSFIPVQFNNLTQDVPNVDFTVSGPTVNIGGSIVIVNGTSNGVIVTATGVGTIPRPCNLSSSVSFISFTCPVPIFGDYTITPSSPNHTFNPTDLFFFEVSQGSNSASFSGTEIPKDPLQLMVENPGPVPDLVLALDAALLVRDPFSVINPLNWLKNNGSDNNTRLAIFLKNFRPVPGEPPSEVVVNLVGNNSQLLEIPAEDVRPLPNTDLVQVTFRLPDNIVTGLSEVRVKAHGEITNSATLRINP